MSFLAIRLAGVQIMVIHFPYSLAWLCIQCHVAFAVAPGKVVEIEIVSAAVNGDLETYLFN